MEEPTMKFPLRYPEHESIQYEDWFIIRYNTGEIEFHSISERRVVCYTCLPGKITSMVCVPGGDDYFIFGLSNGFVAAGGIESNGIFNLTACVKYYDTKVTHLNIVGDTVVSCGGGKDIHVCKIEDIRVVYMKIPFPESREKLMKYNYVKYVKEDEEGDLIVYYKRGNRKHYILSNRLGTIKAIYDFTLKHNLGISTLYDMIEELTP